ncbi:MAG: heavy metal translocating P-type ATPase [Bacteroidales bacterium]|uniref:heavy metal translocating P-type ATPase n=1 Tax=Porphyromonas sp. TaxID=1924944 RepID=UPI002976B23F|nr:heavy metal translocating P-type ATPase [Porphyromonas sp.]MDD7438372.1 heavy metal translocating P-type ATPase [Bacteroidales bacterium]MDY3067998.1 heavy metal translocating P-type ATPase [Porphyromonas sp.]
MADNTCGSNCACNTKHAHDFDNHALIIKRVYLSATILGVIALGQYFWGWWGLEWLKVIVFVLAFLPVGLPVILEGWELIRNERSFFNEYTLMAIASIGAFGIGERYEAVFLMLLYQLGEYLEGLAVNKARRNISELVDVRSDIVLLIEGNSTREIPATEAKIGDKLRVAPGMRVSLDGRLLSEVAMLDQSSLTGESMLVEREAGEEVLAGSLVSGKPIDIEVAKLYEDSTLAKILRLTEEAVEHKPETERFIRRFAKIYTPIVFALAVLVVSVPWLVLGAEYDFQEWLYRGLVFLVVSCPCALVISVPLSYFCGVGAMSKHGLLVKGAVHLEVLRQVDAVVFDKTGTLTEGRFEVKDLRLISGVSRDEALGYLLAIEAQSRHPMALAIQQYAVGIPPAEVSQVEEVTGMGLQAVSATGKRLLVGSARLLERHGIDTSGLGDESSILLGIDGDLAVIVELSDVLKPRSVEAIEGLKKEGIARIVMLSGDKPKVVAEMAQTVGITDARGGLLPDDKMRAIEELLTTYKVAFVGDGLNDAPVMRMSSVGIAMGGMGSDATIEAADLIIQSDDPYKVPQAIEISRYTHKIVLQNIIFALGFKFGVMLLSVLGFASLTLAVIADVGVTLLAVVNALNALRYKSRV